MQLVGQLLMQFNTIFFKTRNTSLVLGFSVYMLYPQSDPEITWIDFFLNDASLQRYLEQRTDWAINAETLSDAELIKLWD